MFPFFGRWNLLIMKVLDVPFQNLGVIDHLAALRTWVLPAPMVIDQMSML